MDTQKSGSRKELLWSVVPFGLFVLLTSFQGHDGNSKYYWYLVKTLVGGALLVPMARQLAEMRVSFSLVGLTAGLVIAGLWVFLDPYYPHLGALLSQVGLASSKVSASATAWNPFASFDSKAVALFFIIIRLVGSSCVVPFLEEVFFRSFVYRYIISANFEAVPLGRFSWKALVITSFIFGLEHEEWLAGVISGFIFQAVVIKTGRLKEAVFAHAMANLALGSWVIATKSYQFW